MTVTIRVILEVVGNYEAVLRDSGDVDEVLSGWGVDPVLELRRLGVMKEELLEMLVSGLEDLEL